MSKRIVHSLESIQIEQEEREAFAIAAQQRQQLLQSFLKKVPIGQIGKCIIVSQLLDPGFGELAFRNIFMGRHPPTTGDRLMNYRNKTSIAQLIDRRISFA